MQESELKFSIKKHEYEKEIFLELDTPKANQYSGYVSIRKDLNFVNLTLIRLLEISPSEENNGRFFQNDKSDELERITTQSLYFSAIIVFGKSFTDASGGRNVKLEKKEILKLLSDEEKQVFEDILNTRHNYVAHGGKTLNEEGFTKLIFTIENEKSFLTKIGYTNLSSFGNSRIFYRTFLTIVYKIMTALEIKIKKLSESILSDYRDHMTANSLLKKAVEERGKYLNNLHRSS